MSGRPRAAGFVAECFWPGVRETDVDAADARAHNSASALSNGGESVRYLGSVLFPADEVVFFHFAAATEQAARRVSEHARLPFERIVEAVALPARLSIIEEGVSSC